MAAQAGANTLGDDALTVDAGADANKQSKDGGTALMWAAGIGGEHGAEMMRVLVGGADGNKQTKAPR